MSTVMIDGSPSPAKLALVRRFLIANGTQADIDAGRFLNRFAFPGQRLARAATSEPNASSPGGSPQRATDAIMTAYRQHRATWQDEYERHVHWEFDEPELLAIVEFLESAAGRHLLEGGWRMNTYVAANTEDLVERILAEAEAILRTDTATGPIE